MGKKQKRGSFSGSIGFVLAAAGSAVGLGNIPFVLSGACAHVWICAFDDGNCNRKKDRTKSADSL